MQTSQAQFSTFWPKEQIVILKISSSYIKSLPRQIILQKRIHADVHASASFAIRWSVAAPSSAPCAHGRSPPEVNQSDYAWNCYHTETKLLFCFTSSSNSSRIISCRLACAARLSTRFDSVSKWSSSEWENDWVSESASELIYKWLIDWLIDLLIDWVSEWVSKWVSEWVRERASEWMSERESDRVSA